MKKTVRRILSLLLAAVMIAAMGVSASAASCGTSPKVIYYSPNCSGNYSSNDCGSLKDMLKNYGVDLDELLSRYTCGSNPCDNGTPSSDCVKPTECAPKPAETTQQPTEKPTQAPTQAPAQTPTTPEKPTQQPTQAPTKPAVTETQKPTEAAPSQNGTYTVSEYEKEVVRLVNEIRAKNGLGTLSINTELSRVARIKSQDMKDKGYFSHTSPTYGSPFDMMKRFGISYRSAGENIAMGYRTPQAVVDGWMNSQGHRENILRPSFTQIGVGYVASGNYWTQMFIG